jgi:chorismate dehydratase
VTADRSGEGAAPASSRSPGSSDSSDSSGSPAERRRPTRLGAVSYLNTRPHVYGLLDHPDFEVRFDVPSRCAELLEANEIDLGLIPSFEYARRQTLGLRDDYFIVPRVAIASTHAVDSVAMFTRKPIDRIRSIALDTSSRTSANLLRLLCAAWFKIEPAFIDAPPDLDRMLADADAALLIGDPALFTDADALGLTKIDLGSTWREMTGLPFVWAFWAGRLDAAPPDVCRALAEARDRGVRAIDRIALDYAPDDPARAAKVARYLTESIAYDLEGPFESGLRRYYALLAQHGLIDRHAEARFFGD